MMEVDYCGLCKEKDWILHGADGDLLEAFRPLVRLPNDRAYHCQANILKCVFDSSGNFSIVS